MDDLGPLMRLESVPFHYSRGAMKSAIPQNRSGFFSVIRVIVAGPSLAEGDERGMVRSDVNQNDEIRLCPYSDPIYLRDARRRRAAAARAA